MANHFCGADLVLHLTHAKSSIFAFHSYKKSQYIRLICGSAYYICNSDKTRFVAYDLLDRNAQFTLAYEGRNR